MTTSLSLSHRPFVRRFGLLAICALGTALWAGPSFAAPESFQVQLTAQQQIPSVESDGYGMADLTYDPATRIVTWSITYSQMSSTVMMAHFHLGGLDQNGPVQIWLTKRGAAVTSPITGSAKLTAAQAKAFEAGNWYINIHTHDHPAGEIRGQVMPPGA